jgi:farnesyl-diphosphate farnesyltransferase
MIQASFAACWGILPAVSRSFALVIRRLPGRLDDAVMVSYLLCRIADTLEDSLRPAPERRRLLADFAGSLESGRPEIPADGYPAAYRGLMSRTDAVLDCFRSFDPAVRAIVAARVREMCGGMAKWSDREVATRADQGEYCYYVAGLVGRLLTDLFHVYGHVGARCKAQLEKHAVDFGAALQKVNIIRDVRADVEDGRCYWPSEVLARHGLTRETLLAPANVDRAVAAMDDLIEDLWPHLGAALRYLTLLPVMQLRVRMFCAIPLFMALATARMCQGNADVFLSPRAVKIPSRQVRSILVKSLSLGPFNSYLHSWFRRWRRGGTDRVSPFHAVAALLP